MNMYDYFDAVRKRQCENPHHRLGQTYFNVLFEMEPEIANIIRANFEYDPFYNDARIGPFLVKVEELLTERKA